MPGAHGARKKDKDQSDARAAGQGEWSGHDVR